MPLDPHIYSIALDFPGGAVNTDKLQSEIVMSAITKSLEEINTSGDVITIIFAETITSGDQTILDNDITGPAGGLIAAHDNTKDSGPVDLVGHSTIETISTNKVIVSDFELTENAHLQGVRGQWSGMGFKDYSEMGVIVGGSVVSPTSQTNVDGTVVSVPTGKGVLFSPGTSLEIHDNTGSEDLFIESIIILSVSGDDITLVSGVSQNVLITWIVKCSAIGYNFKGSGFGMMDSGTWEYLPPKDFPEFLLSGWLLSVKLHTKSDSGSRKLVVNFICKKPES